MSLNRSLATVKDFECLMSVYMRVVPFADSYLYLCYLVGKVDERKELNCIVHAC